MAHRVFTLIVAALALATVAGMVVLYPGAVRLPSQDSGQRTELVDATLLRVRPLDRADAVDFLTPGAVEVAITARMAAGGEVVHFEMVDDSGDTFRKGQAVRLAVVETEGVGTTYGIADFQRRRPLLLLAVLFVIAVVTFGRWQGLLALAGLAASGGVIVLFLIPAILDGQDPVATALVAASAIMLLTLYLTHGASRKTTAAAVGTALALALTAALSWTFVEAASLTGFAQEEARLLNVQVGGVSLRGLLLAGIILGGLGVLDDVTVAQASTVVELQRANPRAGVAELVAGALAVGRDHVAATVNTLFLAYTGAALPLLMLFAVGQDPVVEVLTSEVVAVEVVRALVGSIGLITAVPATTLFAALVAHREPTAAPAQAAPAPQSQPRRPNPTSRPPAPAPPPAPRGPHPPVEHAPPGQPDEDEDWVRQLRGAYRLHDDIADE